MKRKLQNIILLLYSIISICFLGLLIKKENLFSNISNLFLITIIALITIPIIILVNNRVLKKQANYNKNNILSIIIFFLLNTSIGLILNYNNLALLNIFLIILQTISSIGIYKFINSRYDKQTAYTALLLVTFGNVYVFINNLVLKYIILNSISSIVLAITTYLDTTAVTRKKNYIIMSVIGILSAIGLYLNKYYVLYILFILMLTPRNQGLRNALKLIFTLLIFTGLSYILLNELNIEPIVNNTYILNYYNLYIYISFLIIGIIGSIYAIRKKEENKIGLICRLFIIIQMILLVTIEGNISSFISLFPIYIILSAMIYKNLPLLSLKKIKTKKVRNSYKISGERKVSAVIPNYNYENFICERIDSVLNQTYKVSELIVLDDVSKDNSVEVIEKKLEQVKKDYPDLTIRFIKNKTNSGNVFKQWAKCFEVSTCDYLWICEADDSASPYFLETIMKGFDNKNVILSYSESLTMDENNKLLMPDLREWIDIYQCGKWNKSYTMIGEDEIKTTLCINNTIANVSSVVFRKKKEIEYQKYLKVAEEFKLAGDWYFYVKVLEHGDISYNKKSLNYHRMHSKSVTLTTKNDLHYKEICRIQDMILKKYKLTEKKEKQVYERRESTRKRLCLGHDELRLLDKSFEKILNKSKVKNEILLSIIIPVYNTEKYLRKCLDSVIRNIPPKTEVLIINDGSPDNSDQIGKEYEEKYPNIVKQYIKKNGGLSSAKNYGLEKAKGKYIIYLDSDDYVSHNMYMTMLKKALETNADIVYCDIFEEFENGTKNYISMTNYDRKEKLMKVIDTPLMATSCNKIVKKELYGNLRYPEGLNNEDVAVTPVLLSLANKIEKADSAFYNYLQRTGSIQNSGFSTKRFVIFETSKMCFNELEKRKSKYIKEVKGSIYTHQILGILLFIIPHQKRKERLKLIEEFCKKMNEFDDYDKNEYVLQYLREHHVSKIVKYIKNNNIKKLDTYLQIKMRWM